MGNKSSESGSLNQPQEISLFNQIWEKISNFNLCLRPQQSNQLSKYLQNFDQISLYNDPYYGQCYVLQSKIMSTYTILQKHRYFESQYKQNLNVWQEIQSYNANKNIISLEIIADFNKQGFLWNKQQLYLAFDYILADLEKQFQNRIIKGLHFTQLQINIIAKEICKGLIHLQHTSYNSLRMRYIYLCKKGNEIKVAHPKLFSYESNISCIYYNNSNQKGIYLSPEEIKMLERLEITTKFNKNNSYSLGMIILSLMNMKYMDQIYDYNTCQIDYSKINEVILQCKTVYSEKIINLVQLLLRKQSQNRISIRTALNQLAEKYNFQNHIQVTLIKEDLFDQPVSNYDYKPLTIVEEPQHKNYLTGLIYPKVGLKGQYFYLKNQNQMNSNSKIGRETMGQNSVIAYQRHNYENINSQYIGSAVKQSSYKNLGKPIRQGQGMYTYQDGQLYIGQWHRGKMQGYGKLFWFENKVRYEGEFKNGLFHGYGTEWSKQQIKKNQDEIDETFVRLQKGSWLKYEGNYRSDIRVGSGKAYFRKGIWVGNFKNNQPNGQGIFYPSNNTDKVKGCWQDGIIKQ